VRGERSLGGLSRSPAFAALAAGFFLAGLSAGDDVALPFLARDLGAGERGIGALYAAVGAGLIAGYVLLARRRRVVPAGAGLSANAYGAVNVEACLGLVVAGPLLDATSARAVLVASGGMDLVCAWVSRRAGRMSP
jgi:hypothetical protein